MAPLETSIIRILLFAPGAVLGVFVLHQVVLCLLSVVALLRRPPAGSQAADTRFAVLVPAHDEAALIEGTVRSILAAQAPGGPLELFVIADNCTDDTARVAAAAGARVLERQDLLLRGKPHALDWAIGRLDLARYDALAIVDADTHVHPEFFVRMAAHLARGRRALQGYFGVQNPDCNWLTRLSLMPAALKFRLQFPGKDLAGLSCPLAGNGMCFDIGIIRSYGWKAYSLTENWEYWAQLALAGVRVAAAPDAVIYSQVADSLAAGRSQRLRWMKGRIDTLRSYGGALIARGLREPSVMKLEAAVELARPSHANLFFWSLAYAAAATALAFGHDLARAPATLAIVILAAQLACFLAAFVWDRPPARAWLALLMVPWYLAWKLAISFNGIRTLRDRRWIRTRRNE